VPLGVARAAAAGLVHGPAELLPVSSSAHTALLVGDRLDGAPRKAFEVALHAGSLPGLVRLTGRPRAWFAALTVAPPALAGLLLEGPIERRLGTPRGIAAGLLAGSALLAASGTCQARTRTAGGARPADAVALGLAQAAALVPGLSRTGMTVAAARARGFADADALALSREAAVPVLVAATTLKAARLVADGVPRGLRAPLAAGLLAATASGLAAAPRLDAPPLWPWSVHRTAVAALLLGRGARRR
jgi:undecaprenyl-diphosphatase